MDQIKEYLFKYKKVFIVLLLVLSIFIGFMVMNRSDSLSGIAYIQKQESKDTEEIAEELRKIKIQERNKSVENGTIDIFGLFDDYVIFGDSRAMGFSSFGFLLNNRVYASSGNSILNVDDWLNSLTSLKPHNIFISYGVNDMGLNLIDLAGGYSKILEEQVKKIVNVCPSSEIYINSIIPATDAAVGAKNSNWGRVNEYNQQIRAVCKKNKWHYIDNSNLVGNGDMSIYQQDGIHFVPSFYSKWAQNMIEATL